MWRKRLCVLLLGLAIGWMASEVFSPPQRSRPVLTWVARVARLALWWFAFSEPPQQCPAHHGGVGADGFAILDHGESI